ncbi:serine/threonine-protein kinase [Acinetobacter towneri]|uniref:serine/threonine-protein kinase n=1 Tax=Acinetobacter towneri TaxID=202956 RepID=UPI00209A63D0|nr:serine/threonine-protein kinase [Acinetobacter towneri]MCO8056266.1 serine/threonine protein kinase [Acinetobacter towneri]
MIEHGNYKIKPKDFKGGGAFGSVEVVELYNIRGHLCGLYAMKTLKATAAEVENFRRRFIREGYLQASCIHTNIVPIYLYNLHAANPWFVMELGENDVQTLLLSGTFTRDEKLKCLRHLLEGLLFIHAKGFLHRDIKPSNMVRSGGVYKIADFGLVKNTSPSVDSTQLTAIGQGMGTPGFLAPEAIFGVYNEQTDIYAVGTFIEYLIHNDSILEKVLSRLFKKCKEHLPANRYQNIKQVLEDYIPIMDGLLSDNTLKVEA